jgi:hypothetical protein
MKKFPSIQMANKCMKKCPAIKEMPVKMTSRFFSLKSEWLLSRTQLTNACENTGGGQKEHLYSVFGNINQCSHYENQYGGSSKN